MIEYSCSTQRQKSTGDLW